MASCSNLVESIWEFYHICGVGHDKAHEPFSKDNNSSIGPRKDPAIPGAWWKFVNKSLVAPVQPKKGLGNWIT